MNRRELLRLAALAGMGSGLTACGINTQGGVVVDGAGPTGGSGTGGGLSVTPPGQAAATTPVRAVEAFLAAAAGTEGERLVRLRAFIAPTVADEWKPSSGNVNVVRHGDIEPKADSDSNSWSVSFSVTHVGILKDDGTLAPPTADTENYTITVSEKVDGAKGGYYIVGDLPKDILLSEGALRQYYEERCLYFWNTNTANSALVPDLRYVTRAVDDPRRMDTLITWLTAGQAPWLEGAVLPQNLQKIGNLVEKDGKIVVNLKSGAKSVNVNKLGSQLRWTLRKDLGDTELAIEIESEPVATVQGYLSDNPAWRPPSEAGPERFVIVDGRVHVVDSGVPVPQLSTTDNKQIEWAAIPRNGRNMIAVVRRDSTGERRLLLGPQTELSNGLRDTTIRSTGEISRPVWLGSESVMVTVDGELWQVGRTGAPAPVPVQPRGKGAITCVAIGPDARRAALIVGGKLYVAAIVGSGPSVSLGLPRLIPTELRNLTAVVFGAEERLVIAGTGDRVLTYIGQINVDGAQYKPMTKDPLGEAKVRSMSAHTLAPTDVGPFQIVFGTSQGSFQLANIPLALTLKGQTASASPSAKPLLNPFYAG